MMAAMTVLIFQHSAVETPGTLLDYLNTRKMRSFVHHWYRDGRAPDAEEFDWLIVLGGPMNVDSEKDHNWLKEEKRFIKDWLESGKPILGICLGGQLLAQALGGKVSKNPQREIGFHAVERNGTTHRFFKNWPQSARVYQYHEDTFSLPPGAKTVLTSPACAIQAFTVEDHVLGLQFHPESTKEWILSNAPSVMKKEGEAFVQNPSETAAEVSRALPPMTTSFFRLLDNFSEGMR
jgi:GMP synthase-like glutamine amidotransferase